MLRTLFTLVCVVLPCFCEEWTEKEVLNFRYAVTQSDCIATGVLIGRAFNDKLQNDGSLEEISTGRQGMESMFKNLAKGHMWALQSPGVEDLKVRRRDMALFFLKRWESDPNLLDKLVFIDQMEYGSIYTIMAMLKNKVVTFSKNQGHPTAVHNFVEYILPSKLSSFGRLRDFVLVMEDTNTNSPSSMVANNLPNNRRWAGIWHIPLNSLDMSPLKRDLFPILKEKLAERHVSELLQTANETYVLIDELTSKIDSWSYLPGIWKMIVESGGLEVSLADSETARNITRDLLFQSSFEIRAGGVHTNDPDNSTEITTPGI